MTSTESQAIRGTADESTTTEFVIEMTPEFAKFLGGEGFDATLEGARRWLAEDPENPHVMYEAAICAALPDENGCVVDPYTGARLRIQETACHRRDVDIS